MSLDFLSLSDTAAQGLNYSVVTSLSAHSSSENLFVFSFDEKLHFELFSSFRQTSGPSHLQQGSSFVVVGLSDLASFF